VARLVIAPNELSPVFCLLRDSTDPDAVMVPDDLVADYSAAVDALLDVQARLYAIYWGRGVDPDDLAVADMILDDDDD
jgi:hypothetical protein